MKSTSHVLSPSALRGAVSQGCLLAVAGVVLILVLFGGCGIGKYNGIVSNDARVEAQWAEINNQYKRRYDLVPQLVETVKGAADFEQDTITAVTEARASVGRMQFNELPEDPAKLQEFFQAQQGLGSALQRLLVVSENYPQLKASQNFLALQDQLEGTENRIAVARRDYIDAVKAFNVSIRTFPGNWVATFGGFEKKTQLEFEESESTLRERPAINFGD